jgi:uncharacterized protein (DUF2141 family)
MGNSHARDWPYDNLRGSRQEMWMRTLLVAACIFFALGRAVKAADIIVTIDGLSSTRGTVMLELADSEASWQNRAPPVALGQATPAGQSMTYTFRDVKPGTYALGIFHDENNNGKFDTNFLGIPKEGWGSSNNPHVMRKATFDEAKFSVEQKDVAITIHLRHVF